MTGSSLTMKEGQRQSPNADCISEMSSLKEKSSSSSSPSLLIDYSKVRAKTSDYPLPSITIRKSSSLSAYVPTSFVGSVTNGTPSTTRRAATAADICSSLTTAERILDSTLSPPTTSKTTRKSKTKRNTNATSKAIKNPITAIPIWKLNDSILDLVSDDDNDTSSDSSSDTSDSVSESESEFEMSLLSFDKSVMDDKEEDDDDDDDDDDESMAPSLEATSCATSSFNDSTLPRDSVSVSFSIRRSSKTDENNNSKDKDASASLLAPIPSMLRLKRSLCSLLGDDDDDDDDNDEVEIGHDLLPKAQDCLTPKENNHDTEIKVKLLSRKSNSVVNLLSKQEALGSTTTTTGISRGSSYKDLMWNAAVSSGPPAGFDLRLPNNDPPFSKNGGNPSLAALSLLRTLSDRAASCRSLPSSNPKRSSSSHESTPNSRKAARRSRNKMAMTSSSMRGGSQRRMNSSSMDVSEKRGRVRRTRSSTSVGLLGLRSSERALMNTPRSVSPTGDQSCSRTSGSRDSSKKKSLSNVTRNDSSSNLVARQERRANRRRNPRNNEDSVEPPTLRRAVSDDFHPGNTYIRKSNSSKSLRGFTRHHSSSAAGPRRRRGEDDDLSSPQGMMIDFGNSSIASLRGGGCLARQDSMRSVSSRARNRNYGGNSSITNFGDCSFSNLRDGLTRDDSSRSLLSASSVRRGSLSTKPSNLLGTLARDDSLRSLASTTNRNTGRNTSSSNSKKDAELLSTLSRIKLLAGGGRAITIGSSKSR